MKKIFSNYKENQQIKCIIMKRLSKLSLNIALLLGLITLLIPRVRANGVVVGPPMEPLIMFGYLNLLFIITLVIEINVIKFILKDNELNEHSKEFYKSITLVNLLTFPTTQIIAFIIYQTVLGNLDVANIIFISILIEMFPITLECLLYLKIYKRLNRILCFKHPVNNTSILKSTITANFASFAIGLFTTLIFLI
jgi:hypothetical protein